MNSYLSFTATASGQITIVEPEVVESIEVDTIWAANGVGFDLKTVGDLQFVVYYDVNRMMTVASRKLGSQEWVRKTLPNKLMWDSHNSVRLGIDPMGYVHVSGNMHVHPLAYFRSTKPYDVTTMIEVNEMVGEDEARVTYPHFFYDKEGSLYYSYRSGSCGNGNILINRFNPEAMKWERFLEKPLFEGIEANDDRAAYHKKEKDSEGNFHFLWIWRWTPMVETSHNICYATTPDLKQWKNAAGEPVDLPFRPDEAAVSVDPTPTKGGMHNSRYGMILTARDEPIVAYLKYDEEGLTQLYLAKFAGDKWLIKKVSSWNFRWEFIEGGAFMTFGAKYQLLGISDDGVLVIDWETETGETGYYAIDIETLEHTDRAATIHLKYPLGMRDAFTNREGMSVRLAYDQEQSQEGSTYVLKWEAEHGGFAQHAPDPIPEGPVSKLMLLKID